MSRVSFPAPALPCALASASLLACVLAVSAMTAPAARADAASPATADASGNQVVKYNPDYFTPFQVSTALDMVFHVPGFSFSSGDSSVRGFAGAAGNVLIDGQRPTSKSGLQDTLNSISSSQVDHVELITGGAPGIDMQGYRQILNIVRKQGGKPSITVGGNYKTFSHDPKGAGFFSYSRSKDGKTTDIYFEAFGFHDNGANPTRRFVYRPDLSDPNPDYTFIPQVAGGTGHQEKISHSRPLLGGKLSVNGNYNPIDYDLDAAYDHAGNHAPEHMDYKEVPSELGLQYERPLTKKITADFNLLRRYDRVSIDDVLTDGADQSHYHSLSQSSEHILSAKLTWQPGTKTTYKFGAEEAFNSRDNASLYTQNATTQNVPFDTVRVEEDRHEYYASGNWQPLKTVSVEAGLRVETSTISVVQQNHSKSFVYPKPRVQLVWSPNTKVKLSWRTERIVGQLNFDDFASSVSLDTALVKAGNPDIVPQKEWQNALTLDYSFWGKGALSVTLKHASLEDTLDFAPIVTTTGIFNSRANIGAGLRDEISTSITLPMDKLRVPGGELKIDYTRVKSSVIDPVTHRSRAISGLNPDNYSIVFNQNFPKSRTSWGFEFDSLNNSPQYNATDAYQFKSADWLSIYAEYKTLKNVTFGLIVQNAFRRRDEYERIVWTGLREQSPLDHVERNVAFSRPFLILRVKKEW